MGRPVVSGGFSFKRTRYQHGSLEREERKKVLTYGVVPAVGVTEHLDLELQVLTGTRRNTKTQPEREGNS